MARDYEYYLSELSNARKKEDPGKPIARNTRLYRRRTHECLVIRYHATEILQFWPDGRCILNLNGWFTRSTVDRINEFSPISLFTRRRVRSDSPVWCFMPKGGYPYRYDPATGRSQPTSNICYVLGDPDGESGDGTVILNGQKNTAPRNTDDEKLITWNAWCKVRTDEKAKEMREQKRKTIKRSQARKYSKWLIDNKLQVEILVEAERRGLHVHEDAVRILTTPVTGDRERVIQLGQPDEREEISGNTRKTKATEGC